MPIRAGDPYPQRSYTVEAVYRRCEHGVWLAMTTAESNRNNGNPAFWDVYILHQALCVDVLPFRYVPPNQCIEYIGKFGDVCGRNMQTMQQYCQQSEHAGHWYRHWVGWSMHYHTIDGAYHALDVYWQPPGLIFGSLWVWYVMQDQCEPADYWRGRMLYWNGVRDLGMDPQPLRSLL